LAELYDNQLTFISIDSEKLLNFPIRETDHVSIATYYRLFAPIVLPEHIDKILYLDCDMIINSSVSEFYNTDINGVALAATLDEDYMGDEKYTRLNLDGPKSYFNAGMLLINLEYWRTHNVYERCIDCIRRIPEKLLLHDQDTLNTVLKGEVKLVSVKFNMQTGFLHKKRKLDDGTRAEIKANVLNPSIIHYTGLRKPWLKHYHHPYISHFRYYLKKSPWNDIPLKKTFKEELRYWRHTVKFALHLKKYPYIIKKVKVD
jgi:lipopolysaccharide biosynthesis glycosyltransferase